MHLMMIITSLYVFAGAETAKKPAPVTAVAPLASVPVYGSQIDLRVPSDWRDGSLYVFSGPTPITTEVDGATQQFTPNIVVTREPRGKYTDVAVYAKEQLALSRKQLQEFKVLEEGPRTVGTRAAFQHISTFLTPQNVIIQQLQAFVLTEEWIYVVTFTTLPAAFAEHRKIFERSLAETVFRKQTPTAP